jgi:hypothetical protein
VGSSQGLGGTGKVQESLLNGVTSAQGSEPVTYQINAQHFTNVSKLKAPERYDYFVKRVADWGEAWTLQRERGWVAGVDDDGTIHVPLWSHPLFAEMCMKDEWSKGTVISLNLDDLLDNVLPQLERDKQRISVMPLAERGGVSVDPNRLREDLLSELDKF